MLWEYLYIFYKINKYIVNYVDRNRGITIDMGERDSVIQVHIVRKMGLTCSDPCKFLLFLDFGMVEINGYIKDFSIESNQPMR